MKEFMMAMVELCEKRAYEKANLEGKLQAKELKIGELESIVAGLRKDLEGSEATSHERLSTIIDLQNTIKNIEVGFKSAGELLPKYTCNCDSLEAEIKGLTDNNAFLERRIAEQNESIQKLTADCTGKHQRIQSLEDKLRARNQHIQALQGDLHVQKSAAKSNWDMLEKATARIKELEADNAAMASDIAAAQNAGCDDDETMDSLRARVAELEDTLARVLNGDCAIRSVAE